MAVKIILTVIRFLAGLLQMLKTFLWLCAPKSMYFKEATTWFI